MVSVRPFLPADAAALPALQTAQAGEMAACGDWRETAQRSGDLGPAWTACVDGRPVASAGFWLRWRGNAFAWALVGEGIPPRAWVMLHRTVMARLAELPLLHGIWRCEAWVRDGFMPGHRWVRMLGFSHEGASPGLAPDGGTLHRYGRVWL